MKKPTRPDVESEIEALTKSLMVLESLEGTNFEPVSIQIIMDRTGFKRDFCTRALKTFRLKGYVTQNENGKWLIGKRFIRFAQSISKHSL